MKVTLRARFMIILIFVLLIPILIPLSGYLVFKANQPETEVETANRAPGFVLEELPKVIEQRWDYRETADPRILVVLLGKEGPIYVNREIGVGYRGELEDSNLTVREMQQQWLGLISLHKLSGETLIGSLLFSHQDTSGIVFYQFVPPNPFTQMYRHPVAFTILFLFLFVLVPAFFSGRFLLSLRRSLLSLEQGASRIMQNDFSTPVDAHSDPTLQPVFETFESMRKQLKENNDQRARFLMAISHDLKTPLTSIKGFVEALEEGIVDSEEKKQRYYEILKSKTELLEERISELIEFSRMETVNWRAQFTNFALAPFFQDLMKRHKLEAQVRGVSFKAAIDIPGETKLHGDAKMLARALENLLDNGITYAGRGGRLELHVCLSEGDNYVQIMLEDSGPGITNKELPLVFEPFYRGDRSRNTKGFGLGLTSVKSIVEAHGGSITAGHSSLGGARFDVCVPVAR